MKRMPDVPEPTSCVACGRPRHLGPQMSRTNVTGIPDLVLLCDDEADCRHHWPVDTYPYIRVGL
jgi:hypothetical protein